MHKLMLLFRQPDDVVEFEIRWSQDFVRAAERMPGLRRVALSRILGGPSGEVDLHLVHEFYFDDLQAMRDALVSQQGQEAGNVLMSFAADEVTLCFAEHFEDDLKR